MRDHDDVPSGDWQPSPAPRVRVRAWHIIFLILVVLATLALAYWQWSRFQSGSGTFQNLGYAFQWPLFGIFAVYAYRMGLKLENQAAEAQTESDDPDFIYQADLREFGDKVTTIDEDFLPARPQLDVERFNEINQPRRIRHDQTQNHEKD